MDWVKDTAKGESKNLFQLTKDTMLTGEVGGDDIAKTMMSIGFDKGLSLSVENGLNTFISLLDRDGVKSLLSAFGLDDAAIRAMRGGAKPHLLKKIRELQQGDGNFLKDLGKGAILDLVKFGLDELVLSKVMGKNEWSNLTADVLVETFDAATQSKNLAHLEFLIAGKIGSIAMKQSIKAYMAGIGLKNYLNEEFTQNFENIANASNNFAEVMYAKQEGNKQKENSELTKFRSNIRHSVPFISQEFGINSDNLISINDELAYIGYLNSIKDTESAKKELQNLKEKYRPSIARGVTHLVNNIPFVSDFKNVVVHGVGGGTVNMGAQAVDNVFGTNYAPDIKASNKKHALQAFSNVSDEFSYIEKAIEILGFHNLK